MIEATEKKCHQQIDCFKQEAQHKRTNHHQQSIKEMGLRRVDLITNDPSPTVDKRDVPIRRVRRSQHMSQRHIRKQTNVTS